MKDLFGKQYTRKGLTIKPLAPLEKSSEQSIQLYKQILLNIDGMLRCGISPYLKSRDLLHLSSTSRELVRPSRQVIMNMCIRRKANASLAVQSIPSLPSLRFLDLSFIELTPSDYINLLVCAKGSIGQNLRVLRLRQRGSFPPSSALPLDRDVNLLRLLSAAVSLQAWPLLEDLDLSGNGIGDAGVGIIVTWLKKVSYRRLKRLGLSLTNISEQGMMQLLQVLAKGVTPIMMRLDLSGNGVEFADNEEKGVDVAARELLWAKTFCFMPLLNDLDLCDNCFEGEVTRGLAKALLRLKQSKLRRLSLGGCSLTDEGVCPLFTALARGCCPYLQEISMHQSCLGREAFTSLGSVLAAQKLRHLKRLDFADNLLSYEVFVAQKVRHLKRIALVDNLLSYEICAHVTYNNNRITGMQEIVTALQGHQVAPQLEYLNLSSTGVEFEEVNEMAHLWKKKLREDGHCPLLGASGMVW